MTHPKLLAPLCPDCPDYTCARHQPKVMATGYGSFVAFCNVARGYGPTVELALRAHTAHLQDRRRQAGR